MFGKLGILTTSSEMEMGTSVEFVPLIELMQATDESRFILSEPLAVQSLLWVLAQKQTLVTGIYGVRSEVVPTTLLPTTYAGFDSFILLDAFGNSEVNSRIASCGKLRCVTQLEGVRIQFHADNVVLIDHEGKKAFRADLPRSVLRLQRREFYRLIAPASQELRAQIRHPAAERGERTRVVSAPVIDISGGGVALLMEQPEKFSLSADQELKGCHIALPDGGHIHATLRVKNVFRLTEKDGSFMHRAGCEFVDLPASQQGMIQKYVMRAERDRKARESGFA